MKQVKEFDCVRMKTEIQERLLREIAELGEDGAARLRRERLVHDPVLAARGATRVLGKMPKNLAGTKDLATKSPRILGILPKTDLFATGC